MTAATGSLALVTFDMDKGEFRTLAAQSAASVEKLLKTIAETAQGLTKQAQALSDRGTANAIGQQAASGGKPEAAAQQNGIEKKDEAKTGGPISYSEGHLFLDDPNRPGRSLLSGSFRNLTIGEPAKKEEKKDETPTLDAKVEELTKKAKNNRAEAEIMLEPKWQEANFKQDNSAVDIQVAKLYYEYSLSMEQRLSLARAQGLKGVTDGFAGMINDVLFGHQQIGDSFRKMIGGWAKSMASFISNFLAQKAILGLLKYIGLGDFFGLDGAAAPAAGTRTSYIGSTIADTTASSLVTVESAHSGGVIGGGSLEGPKASRAVPAALFADAARPPDGGLIRGEVPIVAKAGEAVFTPEQMTNADRLLKSALTAGAGSQINQTVNVTVNGNGGAPEQNADLADRIGWQVKEELRGMMAEEMRQQMRPGGLLNGGY